MRRRQKDLYFISLNGFTVRGRLIYKSAQAYQAPIFQVTAEGQEHTDGVITPIPIRHGKGRGEIEPYHALHTDRNQS